MEKLLINPRLERHPWVSYVNGNYWVFLNTVDGTKIRITDDDEYDAEYPESMDIKITNMCDKRCSWCHEDSKPDGHHADLEQPFLDTIRPYTEVAVGGGNILCHPHLEDYLIHLRELKCLPSITVNQEHFCHDFDYISSLYERGLVFGIGVSLTYVDSLLLKNMKKLPTAVLHTINGLFTERDLYGLSGHGLKLLVLGYKSIRRGADYLKYRDKAIENNMSWLGSHLDDLFNGFDVVSFDNLALKQLPIREFIGEDRWSEFYMGDDGQHTFYIDMVEKEYAISSTSKERYPIGKKTVRDMFQHIKSISSKE